MNSPASAKVISDDRVNPNTGHMLWAESVERRNYSAMPSLFLVLMTVRLLQQVDHFRYGDRTHNLSRFASNIESKFSKTIHFVLKTCAYLKYSFIFGFFKILSSCKMSFGVLDNTLKAWYGRTTLFWYLSLKRERQDPQHCLYDK